jgi:uncharacterized protein
MKFRAMNNVNPFIITGYNSPAFFCDRENEVTKLTSSLKNNRNTTLISIRRMGKTALIDHLFFQLQDENDLSLHYLDLLPTSNLSEFTKAMANAVIGKFEKKPMIILQKLMKTISHLRPKISIDTLTGRPTLELDISGTEEAEKTLEYIFQYLGKQNKRIYIAMDEFQQIVNYPEKNMEALLRSMIQKYNNISFIFSGSNRHLLQSIFSDYGRPFYQSTDIMFLDRIDRERYLQFILEKFRNDRFDISELTVAKILDWTYDHTFFVQFVCNRLYSQNIRKIADDTVNTTLFDILKEREPVYYNFRNLLTEQQFSLLKAIAREGQVRQPTSRDFILKHGLNNSSTVQTSLQALINKELVYAAHEKYAVNDVFLSRWLERL